MAPHREANVISLHPGSTEEICAVSFRCPSPCLTSPAPEVSQLADLPTTVEGRKVRESETLGGGLRSFHSTADVFEFDAKFHFFRDVFLHQEHRQPNLMFDVHQAHRAL